jgi:hypothetical protein
MVLGTFLLLLVMLGAAMPTAVYAACNPGRAPGPAGNTWQAGARMFEIEPWGVHADIEGYYPYVPYLNPGGASSLATIMLADITDAPGGWSWIQPGWVSRVNVTGQPSGRHSYVQVWDHYGTKQNFYYSDLFTGSDPVPGLGGYARYAVRVSFRTPYFYMEVKLAGVGWAAFNMWMSPDSVQIFGEITNTAAQFPGDVANHVKFKNTDFTTSNTWDWREVNVPAFNTQPAYLGSDHPASGVYGVWDKACAS